MKAIIKNKTITDVAKNIFGDIVSAAYFIVSVSPGDTDEEIKTELTEIVNRGNNFVVDPGYMSVDYNSTVAIEFTNGKLVEIETSEWGHLRDISLVDIKRIEVEE